MFLFFSAFFLKGGSCPFKSINTAPYIHTFLFFNTYSTSDWLVATNRAPPSHDVYHSAQGVGDGESGVLKDTGDRSVPISVWEELVSIISQLGRRKRGGASARDRDKREKRAKEQEQESLGDYYFWLWKWGRGRDLGNQKGQECGFIKEGDPRGKGGRANTLGESLRGKDNGGFEGNPMESCFLFLLVFLQGDVLMLVSWFYFNHVGKLGSCPDPDLRTYKDIKTEFC